MSASPRVIATGLRFPEGPSLLDDGAVAVVEMQGEGVARVERGGAVTQLGDLGGGPNGSVLGDDGAIYVANNGGLSVGVGGLWHAPRQFDGCIQRIGADGAVSTVAGGLPGPPPHRPNDLCFAPDGRLLVTDSADWERMREAGPGRLLAVGPGGEVEVLLELAGLPNGLAFAPGADVLYLAQSMTRAILAIDLRDGRLGTPRPFATLPSGMPDGLCVSADGVLYVCGSIDDAVHVFSEGELTETLPMPASSQPTNCCLTSEGELLVTLARTGSLVAVDVGAPPLALHRGSINAEVAA